MIDTSSLRQTIINQATSGLLSSLNLDDTSVDSLIAELPEPSNKRKKLLSQSIIMDKVGEIPEHWQWVRLGEISSYGDTPKKVMPSDITDDTWILELEDIKNGGRLLSKKYGSDRKPKGEKTSFSKGQILYSKLRPYLKKVLIADEDGISTPELISFDVYAGIDPVYITYCLTNSYVDRVIEKRSYGIKMPRVDAAFMVNMPIPLPPIEEQRRIVETASQAFAEIDILESAKQDIADDFLILKNKIIDAGIRGELTEQLPGDGTAEDLYQQIQIEKAVLIKEKIIKKSKPLPEITNDEIPFDIPENWKWVRFADLYSLSNGVASRGTQGGTPRPVLRLADLTEGSIDTSNIREIALSDAEYEPHRIRKDDLVFIRVNGSRGKVANAYHYSGDEEISYCDHLFCGHKTSDCVEPMYVIMVCQSQMAKLQIDPLIKTTAGQNTISQGNLGKIVIPLPPKAEQLRIVMRINELLAAMPE